MVFGPTMEFVYIDPHNKKVEEEALFDLAGMICPENTGLFPDPEAFTKFVEPLLTGRRVHAKTTANFVAFAILGSLLNPTTGSWRFLPQCAQEWLAFRRLFLEICDRVIPKELRRSPIQSVAEEDPEYFKEFSKTHKLPVKRRRKARPATERIGAAAERATLKKVVAVRLANYEGVNLSKMRADFIETGRIDLDAECGALYELKQNILMDYVPKSLDFPERLAERTTLQILKEIVEEKSLGIDLVAEYKRAAISVREVLFDVAVEATFGEVLASPATSRELEENFYERRLIEDPYAALSDERIIAFLADGMANRGEIFLKRLASLFATAEKNNARLRHDPLRVVMAIHWLDLDFPLWLMRLPAILSWLSISEFVDLDATENKVRERIRAKDQKGRTFLVQGSKLLVTDLVVREESGKKYFTGMNFPLYIAQSGMFKCLRDHVDGLIARHR